MLSIREIGRRFGADNVFIISKAGLKMAQLTKTWLLETMAIDAITGFNPKNIHFCRKISGSEGKGEIAQKLGITHMIDDQDEALRTTYQTINDSGDPFPPYGQLFHIARSGNGPPPQSQKWQQEDRPPQVFPVGSWNDVLSLLNLPYIQNTTTTPCPPTFIGPAPEQDSPWDQWIAELDYEAPASELQIPAMPLLPPHERGAFVVPISRGS